MRAPLHATHARAPARAMHSQHSPPTRAVCSAPVLGSTATHAESTPWSGWDVAPIEGQSYDRPAASAPKPGPEPARLGPPKPAATPAMLSADGEDDEEEEEEPDVDADDEELSQALDEALRRIGHVTDRTTTPPPPPGTHTHASRYLCPAAQRTQRAQPHPMRSAQVLAANVPTAHGTARPVRTPQLGSAELHRTH
jgi:hypothetical protein